ncbi:MAG: hypothetical protein AABW48_03215 [Nanoarchaeota archaeon]
MTATEKQTLNPSLVDLLKDAPTLKDAFKKFEEKKIFVVDLTHHKNDFKILKAKADYAVAVDLIAGFSFSFASPDQVILPYGALVAYKILGD